MTRRAFTMRLKPDASAEYKRHHDTIWPELVAQIDRSGIASITTFQRGNELFLVSEISDDRAWDRLWNSEIHKRWAELMEPLMHMRDDGIVESEVLTEVFHLTTSGNGQVSETSMAIIETNAVPEWEGGTPDVLLMNAEPATEAPPSEQPPAPAPEAERAKHAKKSAPRKKMAAKKAARKAKPPARRKVAKKAKPKAAKKKAPVKKMAAKKTVAKKMAAKKAPPKKKKKKAARKSRK